MMRSLLFALCVPFVAVGCDAKSSSGPGTQPPGPHPEGKAAPGAEIKTLFVGPTLVDCQGEAPQKCMQVRESEDADWEFFYDAIEGFEYEPSFTYELEVEVSPVADPPADGSSLRYRLIEVVAKNPAPPAPE